METNLELQNRKKKAVAASISTAIGAKEPGSPVSSPEGDIASGISSPPKTVLINGIPHQNLPDQKYPGPLSMVANAAGATITHIATAPFGNRAEERLAANRAELNNDTLPADQQIKPQGIATPPVIPPSPVNQPAKAGRDSHGVITAESAQAAMGADMQRSGGIFGTSDVGGVNAIMARENAARQSMIDAQITQPSPGGIAAPPVDQIEIDNAEKTRRWAIEDAVSRAPANQRAALMIQAMNHDQSNQTAQRGQDKASATADAHNNVTMRGQDIGSRTDANRIAVENPLKQAQTQGILAQNDSAKMLADLQKKALAGDAQAMASYQSITGKKATPATDRYMTVTGGEEVGPDGMTKVKKPSGVFDAQTGQFVQMGGSQQAGPSQADLEHTANKYGMTVEQVKAKLTQQQAPASALDYLKKNPGQSAAFKAKYGYLPEGF